MGGETTRIENRGETTRGETTRGGNVLGAKRLVTMNKQKSIRIGFIGFCLIGDFMVAKS